MTETHLVLLMYLLLMGRVFLHFNPTIIKDRFYRQSAKETADSFLYAGVWALLIINILVRSFYIPSASMVPTLKIGDVLLVNKLIYRFTEPARGDIIVFRPPDSPDRDFIKRVVGVAHDVIEVRDGTLYRNGLEVEEPFLNEQEIAGDFGPFTVPEGELVMMGDNRNNSSDSRAWRKTSVPLDNVVGKATVIFFPPHHISWIHK